ncbi:MAG: hypothetical protein QY871_03375 [Dehalococcoides mccartyi]|uniref:hypothetical protein n=1 Tax=Dehalococcoides mccartyi TaxID=61435 RepID=UPI0025C8689B|nr:hypothetical protein [Dehalococcoides mccartyi]MDN4186099.1 hypothetical protein [Dehalococcoides mccartyi]
MLTIAPAYNPYSDVRLCDILVSFRMVDVDAAALALPFSSGECRLSQIWQTHDLVEYQSLKLASLERDYFKLDGTFILPEEDLTGLQTGWWSDAISGEDKSFDAPPSLGFSWNENQTSVGFTLCFDDASGMYASLFRVSAYDLEGNLIQEKLVENSSVRCIVDMPTENYRYVVIEFLETSEAWRRIRITEMLFGIVQYFNRENTVSASIEYGFSPMSESLPASELTLVLDNSNAVWNMVNPRGVYAYLQQSQPLDVWFYVGTPNESFNWDEEETAVYMGRYYFTTAAAEDDSMTAKITAHDNIFRLEGKKYRNGTSGQWTIFQAISAVIEYSGTNLAFEMPEEISSRLVGKNLPKDCTCREAIRLLAQAACSACYVNRDGVLIFFDPLIDRTPVDTINYDNMSAMPKIAVAGKVNLVELSVKDEYAAGGVETIYVASDIGVDEQEQAVAISNPVAVSGEAVAAWLLEMLQRRLTYNVSERGNPAREITDVAVIWDAYGENRPAVISRQRFNFDGGLKCETEAWGGGF